MFLRTLFLAFFFILTVLAVVPVFLVCLILGWREPLLVYARGVMRAARLLLGLRVRVTGREHLAGRTPRVFMANHVSFLDGPLLFLLVPERLRVILKKTLFRIPIVGLAMKYVGFVSIDRRRAGGGRAGIERASARMREDGLSFLIFPEGTRSLDGKLQSFRRGGFFLALGAGAPIVPASIRGAFRIMPRGRCVPRRGSVDIVFHAPVETAGTAPADMDALMDKVRNAIAAGLEGDPHD